MNLIVLEDRLEPILIWQLEGRPSDEAVARIVATLGAGPFVSVIDARSAGLPPASQLLRIAAASALGVALVLPSPALRRALVHVMPWRTLAMPHVLCPHMAAAMLWAEGRLIRAAA